MIKNSILDCLFPRRCPVCGEIVEPAGRLICPSCLFRLSPVKNPTCKKCGKEIASAQEEYCADCQRRRHSFEYGLALLNYIEYARRSLSQVKYKNKREYLDFYGAAMVARFGKTLSRIRPDALVPVPIHSSRRRIRGFNQAEVLAESLGNQLGIPVCPEFLIRSRRTQPQKELTPAERLKNLSRAFQAGPIPPGIRSVVLVDDIYTTGSTAEACTRILKSVGVERVYVLVICIVGGR